MDNIDVSGVAFSTNFPTIVRYDVPNRQVVINLASYSVNIPALTPQTTNIVYDVTSSVALDKNNGIANTVIEYMGAAHIDFLPPIRANFRGIYREFFFGSLVGGVNQVFPSGLSDAITADYFVLTTVTWFDAGRMYLRAVLQYTNAVRVSSYTAQWAGGALTARADLSLLPY